MILVGNRIILRPLIDSDFEKYFKWHSEPEIRFQTAMHPYLVTEQNERDWFNRVKSDMSNKRFIFTIVLKENDEVIGYFQLTDVNMVNRNAMLGIVIGEEEYRRQGLGEEIMELGINYGFKNLELLKISLDVINENNSAINLYKKIGFIEEGIFKNHFFFDGQLHNVVRMAKFRQSS